MAIKIPGYDVLIPNAVYSRKEVVPLEAPLILTNILIIGRYVQPSKDDVVAYLKETAEDVGGASALFLPGTVRKEESVLEMLIRKLPQSVLNKVRIGEEELVEFIRQSANAPQYTPGEAADQYVNFRFGKLPADVLKKSHGMTQGKYHSLLSHPDIRRAGFGEQFAVRLLLAGGKLPPKDAVDFLMVHGTYGSRTFAVNDPRYDSKEMAEVISAVYEGVVKGGVAELDDKREQVLEEAAIKSILVLHENLRIAEDMHHH